MTLVTIINGLSAVITFTPAMLETANRIRTILQATHEVELRVIQDNAIKSADETISLIEEWRRNAKA